MGKNLQQTLKENSHLVSREIQLLLDDEGKILSIGLEAKMPLGVSHDSLIHKNFFESIEPINNSKTVLEPLKTAKRDEILKLNFRLKFKNKTNNYFESRITYLKSEKCFIVLIIERESSLFEWNLYQKTQHVAKIGGWSFDVTTSQMQWSQQMYQLFNVSECSYPTHKLNDLIELAVKEDKEKLSEALNESLSEKQPLCLRFRTLSSRLEYCWIELRAEIEFSKDMQRNYLIGTCQDITEKVQREEELEKEKSKVQHAAKLSSLGEMAGNIAHEINNPLTIIMGHAKKTHKDAHNNKLTPEKASFNSERIIHAVTRMSKITKGLKSYIRKETKTEMVPTDIKKIIEETLEFCAPRQTRKNVSLEVMIKDSLHPRCRQLEISQVILNLINNAFDAIAESPKSTYHWIRVKAYEDNGSVKIEVSDSGVGFKEKKAEKAFETFYTTKPIDKGTGLGLSIARTIIDEHKGNLQIISKHNPTTIGITLPLEQKISHDTHEKKAA